MTMFDFVKTRYTRWQRYSRTKSELQGLSNRELADLGIARTTFIVWRGKRHDKQIEMEALMPLFKFLSRRNRMQAYRQARKGNGNDFRC
jgi:hypothetical protein